jgi:hypothetical protein
MNWDFGTLQQPSISAEHPTKHDGISPLEFTKGAKPLAKQCCSSSDKDPTSVDILEELPRATSVLMWDEGMEPVVEGAGDVWQGSYNLKIHH